MSNDYFSSTGSQINFGSVCRFCLSDANDNITLNFADGCFGNSTIADFIGNLISIKIDTSDNFPNNVCTACAGFAALSFKFAQQCIHANTTILSWLSSYTSPSDDSSDDSSSTSSPQEALVSLTVSDETEAPLPIDDVASNIPESTSTIWLDNQEPCLDSAQNPEDNAYFLLTVENEDSSECTYLLAATLQTVDSSEKLADLGSENELSNHSMSFPIAHEQFNPEETLESKNDFINARESEYIGSEVVTFLKAEAEDKILVQPNEPICTSCGSLLIDTNGTAYCSICFPQTPKNYNSLSNCKTAAKIKTSRKRKEKLKNACFHCGLEKESLNQDFKCIDCEKNTNQVKESSYKCGICQEVLKSAASLKRHNDLHLRTRLFHCNLCPKSFNSKRNIAQHIRRHLGFPAYTCKCGKSFLGLATLTRHKIVHSGKKNHFCSICSKPFYTKYEKNVHERTHDSRTHLKCTCCEKVFTDPRKLRIHLMCSKNVRPYKCRICDKGEIYRSGLIKHLKFVHAVKDEDVKEHIRMDPEEYISLQSLMNM